MPRTAGRRFYSRDSESLARALLGTTLVRTLESGERLAGTIVETEAYVGVLDRASHAFGGRRSPRNESMYARPGTLYVYFTYGMHYCANIVCGKPDEPVAVLLRALVPTEGLDTMRRLRLPTAPDQSMKAPSRTLHDWQLCRGPGNLCRALGIDRALDSIDLVSANQVSVEIPSSMPIDENRILSGPRIGIGNAAEWVQAPLRFWIRDSRSVSRSGVGPTGGQSSV